MLTLERRLGSWQCCVSFTERRDTTAQQPPASPAPESIAPENITWLKQQHGSNVLRVERPGGGCGTAADAAWTSVSEAALQIRTADCVPIALYGDSPIGPAVAAVHAGWRGLLAGVVQAAAASLRAAGFGQLRALIGPYIHPIHYEFSPRDLGPLKERYGTQVESRTATGTAALDLGNAAKQALRQADVWLDHDLHRCTGSQADRYFSHRLRRETGRLAMTVVLADRAEEVPPNQAD